MIAGNIFLIPPILNPTPAGHSGMRAHISSSRTHTRSTTVPVFQKRLLYSRGGYRIYERGGAPYMKRCRRQCIEARSADQSVRSAEKIFRLHFSLFRMGSRGTFALCTASSRCTRIAGPKAAMSFFLAYFAQECNTYVHGGVY